MRISGPLDFITRLVMLVLAGMVSLSIIGAIASIPSGSIEGRMGLERRPQPVPQQVERAEPQQPAPEGQGEEGVQATNGSGPGEMIAAAPEPEPEGVVQWLEAITYALLALVGIAALATLMLWRAVHELRRIADSAEARGN